MYGQRSGYSSAAALTFDATRTHPATGGDLFVWRIETESVIACERDQTSKKFVRGVDVKWQTIRPKSLTVAAAAQQQQRQRGVYRYRIRRTKVSLVARVMADLTHTVHTAAAAKEIKKTGQTQINERAHLTTANRANTDTE